MPMYDFKCNSCNKDFEKFVKMNDSCNCKYCNSSNVEKKTSTTSFVLTGSGNYKNGNYFKK